MNRCLYFILPAFWMLSACNDTPQPPPKEKEILVETKDVPVTDTLPPSEPADTLSNRASASEDNSHPHFDPFTTLSGFSQTAFAINPSRDTVIRTSNGMRLLVRANSFARNGKRAEGNVILRIKEMPLAGMDIAGKQLSYVFSIEAFKGKTPLSLSGTILCGLPDGVARKQNGFCQLWEDEKPEWRYVYPPNEFAPVTSAVPFMDDAAFPGGQEAMKRFLLAETVLPADIGGVEGMLFVEVTISEFGDVKAARVTKPLSNALDASVLRAIQKMPRWHPAVKEEENEAVVYSIPVEVRNGSISYKDAVPTWQQAEREEVFYLRGTGIYGAE